jgi:E3 ubiquitin-protein ligase UBR4
MTSMFLNMVLYLSASAGNGQGHVALFRAALEWLELVKRYTLQKNVLEKLEQGVQAGRHMLVLENASHLLSYVSNVVLALKYGASRWGLPSSSEAAAAAGASTTAADDEMSWTDELLEDDDGGASCVEVASDDDGGVVDEEEDEDEETLEDKLCTYTQTARVYMNQHWYHCHTCGMVDRDGCCSVCARVCHRDHDVTYSKHGSFFCDCGAREGGSCLAMTPRAAPAVQEENAGASRRSRTVGGGGGIRSSDSVMKQNISPGQEVGSGSRLPADSVHQSVVELARKIEPHSQELRSVLAASGGNCMAFLLEMAEALAPVLESSASRSAAPLGATARIRAALQALHTAAKTFEASEALVVPTLGSQEGAFENVKMNFSGEQGQTIRQLLSAHMIRRGIMCCLSAPGGRRQHLAVAHEKGKITVLQLSALLRQADTSQKKLTLTRLASAPVPFTVLSLVSNPSNENFLAVCGLKECRVLTFNSTGSVSEQLVLQPQLEAANYIVRPLWLPSSQTQLAVVTADMVKVYDLAADALSPAYYFLLPSGKIRDATFVHTADGDMVLLLMSSAGHIYFQQLCDEASARNGSFYVTNILKIDHPEVMDVNGNLCGGGVSIYFSHSLQLLFFSFAQGKSFMAPVAGMLTDEQLSVVYQLQFKAAPATSGPGSVVVSGGGGKNNGQQQQPLCGWSEVVGHPGLVTAVLQQSGNPLIIMVEPERAIIQEIKIGAKAKIMDMVAIRHVAATGGSVSGEEKTTLILLCEDGSLKIYMAGGEATGFWLRPQLQPPCSGLWTMVAAAGGPVRPSKRKRAGKIGSGGANISGRGANGGHLSFSTDFFEHCQPQVADIEFGGSDVLQIYNVGQIKQRLQTGGLYIANTKPGGFQMEIANNDPNTVVVAIRVLLGSQDLSRVPSSLQLFGRTLHIGQLSHARWFEFPLAREESLQCQGRLLVNFGPSQDPEGVNMIDSIQVGIAIRKVRL